VIYPLSPFHTCFFSHESRRSSTS